MSQKSQEPGDPTPQGPVPPYEGRKDSGDPDSPRPPHAGEADVGGAAGPRRTEEAADPGPSSLDDAGETDPAEHKTEPRSGTASEEEMRRSAAERGRES